MTDWCRCPEPLRDNDDPEAWCWRCRKPIEAHDPKTGEPLGHAEDDE